MEKPLPTTSMILSAVGLKQHQDFIVFLVTVKLLELPNLTKNTCTIAVYLIPQGVSSLVCGSCFFMRPDVFLIEPSCLQLTYYGDVRTNDQYLHKAR